MVTGNSETGITVTYDDVNGKLDFEVTASGGGDMLKSVYDSDENGIINTKALGTGTANSLTFLRGDSSWQTVSGVGGSSSTDYIGIQVFS